MQRSATGFARPELGEATKVLEFTTARIVCQSWPLGIIVLIQYSNCYLTGLRLSLAEDDGQLANRHRWQSPRLFERTLQAWLGPQIRELEYVDERQSPKIGHLQQSGYLL
jgi:hypothetical protein